MKSRTLVAVGLFVVVPVLCQEREFVAHSYLSLGLRNDRTAYLDFGDVDGDGDLDVAVANGRHWPQRNELYLNNGRGRFTLKRPLGNDWATSYATPFADLDGDGHLDIAVGNDQAPNLILKNDGKGVFTPWGTFGDPAAPKRSLTVADLNGDGHADILVANRGRENAIYFNDGVAGFKRRKTFGTRNDSTITAVASDMDQDGDLDLVLANRDGQTNVLRYHWRSHW